MTLRRLLVLVSALAAASGLVADARARLPRTAAFIRVDQLGYAAGGPKRAFLLANVSMRGATFTLRPASGGAPVFTGTVGAGGAWSARFRFVHSLDFDALSAPGRYVVDVSGVASATSPPFVIGQAASVFGRALRNARSFYENERDGPDVIRSALRTAPAHLNDAHARVYRTPAVNSDGAFKGDLSALGGRLDASGGWWDAGDYLKFVQTTSYTVAVLLTGVRDFPAQMGASAGPSNFTAEARFGVQWLLRMWNDRTRTFYYQVGIGNGNSRTISDHDIWRLPQADDHYGGRNPLYRYIRHRPVFRAGPPRSRISPNLAGRDAAAFGLCAQVFRVRAPRLAARCLRAGEHIFALADTRPRGRLLTVIPWDFYPETEWRDDLELGATELADAVSSRPRALRYLRAAARWARAYDRRPTGDTLNLYDVSGLAHFELYRAIDALGDPTGLAIGAAGLIAALGSELRHADAIAGRDPFGFGYPWDVEDTASHGFGLSVMASEYVSVNGSGSARRQSVRSLDDVLGANAWGASFVIGDGTTFPRCPQHQVANIAGSLHGTAPVLAGAVVEGPSGSATAGLLDGMRRCPPGGGDPFALFNGKAVFRDNVQSYSTIEPAIDLSATSPLAFAWQLAAPQPLGGG